MNNDMTATLSEVEVKSVRNATISIDKAEGVVEAFAAAVGNKDSVGDIITSGAFNASLKTRKPRVVWGHNWNEPIGKVLEIREVPSSDPRLPVKMKQAGVGGLFVKVQFNLNSERGREAFASVMFFGEDQEWSIGYKTILSDFDPVRGAKLLKQVELYEVSPVLHGANNLTGTISVKSEESTTGNDMSACEFTYGPDAKAESFSFSMGEKEYFDGHTYERDDESDERRMIRKAFQTALDGVEDLKFVEADKVVFTKPGDGMWMSKYRRFGRRVEMTRPVRARSQLTYLPVEVTPTGPPVAAPHTPMPQMGQCPKCGYTARNEEKREFDTSQREGMASRGTAMEGGGYPISTVEDLKNAIHAIGRSKDPEATKRHIRKRARKLNAEHLIPDSWSEKSGEPEDIETKAGRVISMSNMGKLRQASELLNQVVSAGLPPAPPSLEEGAEEKKSMRATYIEALEAKGEIPILGHPLSLNGKVAHVSIAEASHYGAVALISEIEDVASEYGWAVKAPSFDEIEAGECKTEIYFYTDTDMSTQVKRLAEAIDEIDYEVDVAVEKKEFYGHSVKTIDEVFQAN